KAERLIRWRVADEVVRLIPHDVIQVRAVRAIREIEALTRESVPHIKRALRHLVANSVLADETGIIACLFHLAPVRALRLCRTQRRGEIVDTVAARIFAQHDTGAAPRTEPPRAGRDS